LSDDQLHLQLSPLHAELSHRVLFSDLTPLGSTTNKSKVSCTSGNIRENWKTNYSRKKNSPTSREGSTRRTRGAPTPAHARECCTPRPPCCPWHHHRPRRQSPAGRGRVQKLGRHCLRHLAAGLHLSFPRSPGSPGRQLFSRPQGRRALGGGSSCRTLRDVVLLRDHGGLARHRHLLCDGGGRLGR
jgi:hypothetical protein